MKTITNNKRRVKHSLKHRAQRKYKTHKNKHAKTQLKQYKTHRGGSASVPQSEFDIRSIDITSHNINDFINAYTNSNASPNNFCKRIQFNDINDNTLINNAINIITTQFTQLYTLVIVNCNITVLPESIGNLTQLIKLDLNGSNFLKKLPKEIGNLTELKQFDLAKCVALTELPDSIGKLTQLTFLGLSDCASLINLPDSIGNLTNLEALSLNGCEALTILPYTIALLTKLVTLMIYGCTTLSQLPTNLWLLTHLEYLKIDSYNKITNREILYLLPLVYIMEAEEITYYNTIMDNTNPNSIYNIPIKNFLFPFTEYNVEHLATPEQKELFSTFALGHQKQTPGVDYADDLFQVFQSTYINKIPYGLNGELSIKAQIDVFTNLRTKKKAIR